MFRFLSKNRKDKKTNKAHSPTTENENAEAAEATETAQKRSHFRLDCGIPAIIKLITKNETKQITLGEPHHSLINNLSSGGVRLLSNIDLNDNDCILVLFKIDNDLIVLTSEMKFKSDSPDPGYRNQYGVKFTGTSTKDQDKICKYLFDEQMKSFS